MRPGKTASAYSGSKNLLRFLSRFLPVFLLAAVLPFLIGFVVAPPDISFFTRADEPSELRVWIEPANLVISPDSATEVSIMAQFDGEGKLVPGVSLSILATGSVTVDSPNVTRRVPFSGRSELGKVLLRAKNAGTGQVAIPEGSVKVTAFEWPLKVRTAGSNVIVR